jgi:hypothetical protein
MNWIAELGIILFTFNALGGPIAAVLIAIIYALWKIAKVPIEYQYDVAIHQIYCEGGRNGSKRNKK